MAQQLIKIVMAGQMTTAPYTPVTWIVYNQPDPTGAQSGYPLGSLTNIGVDYIVDPGSVNPTSLAVGGDLSGTIGAANVVGLQDKPISSTAPTTNQLLAYSGSTWTPVSQITLGAVPATPTSLLITGDTISCSDVLTISAGTNVEITDQVLFDSPVTVESSALVSSFLEVDGGIIVGSGGSIVYTNSNPSPGLSQNTRSSDHATFNTTIAAQAPFITASGSNRNPGSIVLALAAPTNSGTTRGSVVMNDNSTTFLNFTADASGNATIKSPLAMTISANNGSMNINASAGVTIAGSMALNGAVSLGNASVSWSKLIASPTLTQAAQTSDTATTNLSIVAQAPYSLATGTNRAPGFITLGVAAPTNSGTSRGGVVVQDNGNTVVLMQAQSSGTDGQIALIGAGILSSATSLKVSAPSLGFYSASPVAQASRAGQLTDSTGGSVTTTLAAGITDTVAKNAIASLAAKVNALELLIHNIGISA